MTYATYRRWRDIPTTDAIDISVVIPAYNEKERIVPTIGAFAAHLSHRSVSWELIVSDDGSTDETRELVGMLDHANIRVLETEANTGKGGAVARGVAAARGDKILFADADCSTPAHELSRLVDALDGGAHVAIGSRAASGAQVENRSGLRRLMTFGLRMLVRLGLGIPARDTQCGFKLFDADAARRLFAAQTIEGFAFDLEVLYLAERLGMKVAELPVEWHDAPGSKVDARREVVNFLRAIVRIRYNALRGVYARA